MQNYIHKAMFAFHLCLVALVASTANAQTSIAEKARDRLGAAVQKLQTACGDDVTKYCSNVTPGEGRLLFCMMAHEDKISTKCDYGLYSAARNLDRAIDFVEQAADACWPDIEKLCANVPEGGGGIAQCLVTRKSSVSPNCQVVLEHFPDAK
jgi:cysteine rich repeat protein